MSAPTPFIGFMAAAVFAFDITRGTNATNLWLAVVTLTLFEIHKAIIQAHPGVGSDAR